MNSRDNPFAQQGGYSTTVQYAQPEPAAPRPVSEPPADLIKDTTTAAFTADVLQESRKQTVLVDFWAPWCGPCKQLTPALERAVRAAGGAVKLVKMNIDDHPSIAGQLGIQSIPAVIAFKDGQPVDGFMGAIPESQINDFIRKVGGTNDGGANRIAEVLAQAGQALAAGDADMAEQIYSAVLDQAPDNVDAITGLAGIMFERGELDAASELVDSIPEGTKESTALAGVRAKLTLAREAAKLGDPAALERRLGENPKDHEARFDLAMIQNVQDKRGEAAENLLSIIKADRTWREDGARAQLLKFFEAWGPTDEATLSARRRLSSLLFS